MIFLFGASLLLSLIIGVLMTFVFLPPGNRKTAGILFRLFAGGGLGIGVTSCSYFVCLLTGTRPLRCRDRPCRLPRFGPDLFYAPPEKGPRETGRQLPGKTGTGSRLQNLIAVIFAIELVAFVVSFAVSFLKEPHGRWDAWLIWNMHARFLFRGGEGWREAFASGLDWSHWDYPLLLPLSIARGWTYTGGEGILFPAAMGFIFTFLILGLLLGCPLSP